jgi:hypothetical protein
MPMMLGVHGSNFSILFFMVKLCVDTSSTMPHPKIQGVSLEIRLCFINQTHTPVNARNLCAENTRKS